MTDPQPMDAYRKMLIRLKKDKGANGPQNACVMDKVLGENALDRALPPALGSTQRHANALAGNLGLTKKRNKGIPEAKKTNVYVEKELGDTSYKVTYLGGRQKGVHKIDPPIKHRPVDHDLNAFYIASHKDRKVSQQEAAWRGGALQEKAMKPRRAPPTKEGLLTWKGEEGKENKFQTTTDDYKFHKGHKKVTQEAVHAKRTTVSLGGDKVKKGSTVRTDFCNHGNKAFGGRGSGYNKTSVFMSWDGPKKLSSTSSDYGHGFKEHRGAKPRFRQYEGVYKP